MRAYRKLLEFTERNRMRKVLFLYVLSATLFLLFLAKHLILARSVGFSPKFQFVSGFPVSFYGIYFFTVIAFVLAIAVAYLRKAKLLSSLVLAVCGVGGYEFLYSICYVVSTTRWRLLIPSAGFSATSWQGFSTWAIAEFVLASLAIVFYRRFSVGKIVALDGLVFFMSILAWATLLDFRYPRTTTHPGYSSSIQSTR